MEWKKDGTTGHWHSERDGHKIRLQRSKWGNSTTPAWEIFIDGRSHGKELNLGCAKAEACRCLKSMMERAGF